MRTLTRTAIFQTQRPLLTFISKADGFPLQELPGHRRHVGAVRLGKFAVEEMETMLARRDRRGAGMHRSHAWFGAVESVFPGERSAQQNPPVRCTCPG
jgi:hypothetical protein